MSKMLLRKKSFQWHLLLAWVAAFALLAFCISGITHPLLSWTGPQSSAFMPPRAVMKAEQVNAIKPILEKHNIEQAIVVKLIPSAQGVLLQVTEHNDQARRYFDVETYDELPDYDQQQAQWLARLSTFVYTEINALAGLSNNYKTTLQAVFRNLHTWSWLNQVDSARIILMALLLISIIAMTLTGIALVLLLKNRKAMPLKAKLHRYLAYGMWLPLLMFSISGFYHLLHYGFGDTHRGLQLGSPISMKQFSQSADVVELPDSPLNQISVVQYQQNLAYRLSIAPAKKHQTNKLPQGGGEHAHHTMSDKQTRNARFDGQATEKGSRYFSVVKGTEILATDKDVAIEIANEQLQLSEQNLVDATLVKRFGIHYDFRNKRLPVWQLKYDSGLGDMVFIDPATGILVDRLVDKDRYEGYSFSFLHKWNFLTPFIGREVRDIFIAILMGLIIIFVGLGLAMKWNKR